MCRYDLIYALLLGSCMLQAASCAASKVTPRIVGGKASSVQKLPYLVNLHYNGRFYCGGSLVSARHVVTAGHCAKNLKRELMLVVAGVSTLKEAGVRSKVAKVMLPKKFNSKTFNYDVAVLKLATALTGANIRPIALCSSNWKKKGMLQVSGWGLQNQNAKTVPNRVRSIRVPVISNAKCKRMYSGKARLTGTMLCAARLGKKDACSGDSGGPAVINGQLCGIVSWGIGCARKKFPGIYTSVNKVKSFIVSSMKK